LRNLLENVEKLIIDDFKQVKILQKEKLMAEGGLNEIQTVLGWKIDTRLLKAYLMESKAIQFSAHIKQILKDCLDKKVSRVVLKQILISGILVSSVLKNEILKY